MPVTVGEATVDPRPVAVTRIVTGVVAVELAVAAWVTLVRVAQPATVAVPLVDGLPTPTVATATVLAALWAVGGLLLALGWRARAAAAVVAAAATTTAVWDLQTFSNHLTLLVAVTLLLAVTPSSAGWSVDARRGRGRSRVPYWSVFLLRVQVSSLYAFTAVAKLTTAFLSGDVLAAFTVLDDAIAAVGLPGGSIAAVAAIAVATELFLAVGLWLPRVRRLAVVVGICFHVAIVASIPGLRLELAAFALLTTGTYAVFLTDPGVPDQDAKSRSRSSSTAAR